MVSGGGTWTNIGRVSAYEKSYTNAAANDPTLEFGVTYCYRVRLTLFGMEDDEYSDWSDPGCAEKR
jgi:hypothetical protein